MDAELAELVVLSATALVHVQTTTLLQTLTLQIQLQSFNEEGIIESFGLGITTKVALSGGLWYP